MQFDEENSPVHLLRDEFEPNTKWYQGRNMALLSKPYQITFQFIGYYLSQMYMNPVRTKSITSCAITSLGNYFSQKMSGGKLLNHDTFWAFTIFGLIFGGSLPHYFYQIMSNFLKINSKTSFFQLFIIERLFFMPIYTFFTLYMLSRLEGKNHEDSFDNASGVFPPIVEANFKYLSLLHYINIYFVPPLLRDFVSNIICFFWVMYLSRKRQQKKWKPAV